MSFFRNVTGLLATTSVTTPVGMITGVVLTRYLTAADRGEFAVAMAFAGISALLFQFGLPAAAIYRIRRVEVSPGVVLGTLLSLTVVTSLVVMGLGVLLGDTISARFPEFAPKDVFFLSLAMVPGTLLRGVFASVARALDRFGIPNTNGIYHTIALLALTCVVLILLEGGLVEVLIATLSAHLFFTLLLGARVLWVVGARLRPRLSEAFEQLRFGIKSYGQVLAGQLHERVDIFMLAYFVTDPAEVAFYAVAAGVVQRMKTVPDAIAAASFPQLAGYDDEERIEFACRVSRQSFAWSIVTALGLGVVAPVLVPLIYGAEYEASVLPFLVLLPGMTQLTVYRVLSRYFTASNRQRTNIVVQVVSVATNIGLNLWWIPKYGVVGAAMASLVSYSFEAVLIVGAFKFATGRRVAELLIPQRADLEDYRSRFDALKRRLGLGG